MNISDIIIKERQRKGILDVEDLASSIKRIGLIHPIVVDSEGVLLAGERRLTAVKQLGWVDVPVRRFNELNDLERKEIELEENIRRKNLDWQDEVNAKAELDRLKRELYGDGHPGQPSSGWRVKDTAISLGESVGNVSMDIQVAKALEKFPQLREAKSKTRAYHQYKQIVNNAIRTILADSYSEDKESANLIHGDCQEVLKGMESNSVDLIITDPPFGVDLDKNAIGKAHVNTYEDSFQSWISLMDCVVPELYRVLKEGKHMYIFFATMYYTEMRKVIEESGFNVDSIPCIWYRGFRRANPAAPQRRFRYVYETFFFCWKGEQQLLSVDCDAVFNIPSLSGQQKVHLAEKPIQLGQELCMLSSIGSEVVLDPFAGSGSLIHPSYKLGRMVIGIEKDANFYNIMKERFNETADNTT